MDEGHAYVVSSSPISPKVAVIFLCSSDLHALYSVRATTAISSSLSLDVPDELKALTATLEGICFPCSGNEAEADQTFERVE